MARKKSRNPMSKADRKRMSNLKKKTTKTERKFHGLWDDLRKIKAQQSKLIQRAKARKR